MRTPKYICEVLRRRSFPDFLAAMNNKADPKEWSETWAMFRVLLRELKTWPEKLKDTIILDAGCGKRPTLAVLVALNLPNARVYAVDPQLDQTCGHATDKAPLQGLTLYKCSLGEIKITECLPIIVLANHAHIPYSVLKAQTNPTLPWMIITNPCCTDNRPPSGRYVVDRHIWSPKNTIYIGRSDQP